MASVGLPTGHTTNDILVLVVHAADNVVCTVNQSYTFKGAKNSGAHCRQEIWWKRDGGSEAAPTVTHTAGDDAFARITAYSGAVTTGDPFSAFAQNGTLASLTATSTDITPNANDVVLFVLTAANNANDTSGSTQGWSTYSGTNPTFTERGDSNNATGLSDMSGAEADGVNTSGSAIGARTAVQGWTYTATATDNVAGMMAITASSGSGLPPGQSTYDTRLNFKAMFASERSTDVGYVDATEIWLFKGLDRQFAGPGQWKNYDYPNPAGLDPRSKAWPSIDLRTWVDPFKRHLIGQDTQFGRVAGTPDVLTRGLWKTYDYPNPVGHDARSTAWPVVVLRTWLDTLKMQLIGKDALPFRLSDWPVPSPFRRVVDLVTQVGARIQTLSIASPFNMIVWPNPLGKPFPSDLRTFLNTLALNLTGKDTFFGVPGQPISFNWVYVFSKDRRHPIDLRSWTNSLVGLLTLPSQLPFNVSEWKNPLGAIFPIDLRSFFNALEINLTGLDRFFGDPGSGPDYDWPNPRGPMFEIGLRTWIDRMRTQLRNADFLPFDLTDWPNPRAPGRVIDLLTQAGNWLQNTLAPVISSIPFNMDDWLTPILRPRRKMSAGAMQPPVGQDQMFGDAGQVRTYDWPNPRAAVPGIALRTWLVSLAHAISVVVQTPFSLDDWPNPIVPLRRRAGKYGFRNINLGLDKFFGEAGQPPTFDWPNPIGRVPSIDLRSWFNNLVNTTLSGPVVFPFNLDDWPNPRGYLASISLRTWLDSLKTTLIGQDFLPFSMDDWPNPRGWPPLLRTWFLNILEGTLSLPVFTPFNMLDWPNPREYLRSISLRTWLDDMKIRLIGADALPFSLDDWPLPVTILRSIDLRTWLQNLSRFAPLFIPPFFLTEWPVPAGKQFAISLRTFVDGVRLNLIGRDFLPFAMTDWPVPKVRLPGIDLRTFVDRLRMQLIGKDFLPFFQSNWPVPRGYARATDLLTSIWNPLYALITSIFKLPVGKTAYQATIHGILSTSSTLVGPSGFASVIEASTAYGNAP